MTQELWPGGPLFRDAAPFRLSTDSVLLADFTRPRGAAEGIDLGCGSGVLSLLLALKDEKLHMTGLELLPEAAAAARENAALNGLDGRIAVVEGDSPVTTWKKILIQEDPVFAAANRADVEDFIKIIK